MGSLFFPQLSSGALAQFPVRKNRVARTVKNVLPDGTMVLYSDPSAAKMQWQLSYTNLPESDLAALQNHFSACAGPVHAFTFIDPTENMLVWSADLTAGAWQTAAGVAVAGGQGDPAGGVTAFRVTNTGQAAEEIAQTLAVPSGYQYCFSLYASSAQPGSIGIVRRGSSAQETIDAAVGPAWTRIVSSGKLSDAGNAFTIAISLAAGQQVNIFGLQLEPQIAPSGYRPTQGQGGIYANAHWATDRLTVVAEGPDLFATSFVIESALAG